MKQKKPIGTKQIVAGLLILLLLTAAAAFFNNAANAPTGEGYALTISREGEDVRAFSLSEIKKMDAETVEKEIVSSSHEDEKGAFTGVPLAALLDAADPSIRKECETFVTLAGDSYSSALSAEEVAEENNVLVVYQKDGRDLTPFSEGGTGPMRILILSDEYGNRCTKYLIRVECR